jgi:curved DNA-binding protein CbpA
VPFQGAQEVFLSEAHKRTPKPSPLRRDAKSFPLSPTDGYVLSRVDGALTEADLTASTGLPDDQVRASLAKLESLGLIVFEGAPPAAAAPPSGLNAVAARPSSVQIRAAAAVPTPATATATAKASPGTRGSSPSDAMRAAVPVPPPTLLTEQEQASLVEDIDLDPELRRRVISAYRNLDRKDYYALLGVEESVDRKAIKRAYYELAAAFHPDRYFRKRLGSFKLQMETVFAKLTLAHDTLSDKERRSEYNAYLSEQRIALAIEEHLARGVDQAQQTEANVERAISDEIAAVAPLPPPPPDTTTAPQVDVAARRDALARRLFGGRAPSSRGMRAASPVGPGAAGAVGPRSPTPQPMAAADAVNALKRRYEERVAGAKASEARKFAAQADLALTTGDMVAAANALRIASNLTPDNAELVTKYNDAKSKADVLLSETYTKQARYEETNQQWPEAARSWGRVCKVSPSDANAHERAAHAVLKAAGDLHDGARFAQHACEIDPKNPLYRITLASCYAAAGLTLNAKRELDTAAQLAPHDDNIQAMIKRVGQPA